MPSAITVIRDEHRALASVLKGLQYLVEDLRTGRQPPDFPLMKAMIDYIQQFPDRLHHPKEDQYIFPVLRERDPATGPDLDILEAEHESGPGFINRVMAALVEYERDAAKLPAFAQALDDYAAYQWAHMNREEEIILPAAEKALLPGDWVEINAAFKSNNDPLVGVSRQKEFRELFRRVVNLMPAPYGLGPARN